MSLIIIGAGPNLGQAIARRFGREGFSVGLVSRTQSHMDALAMELEGDGIRAAGAAVKPYPARAGVGISFAGEVAYARMLREQLAPEGITVAHTAIAGRIAPGEAHEPDDVADVIRRRHAEPGEFQVRLGFEE
jgi:NAD(P)-dependent dehydrogenase (short-subunit alcohol dehydrogenase family)